MTNDEHCDLYGHDEWGTGRVQMRGRLKPRLGALTRHETARRRLGLIAAHCPSGEAVPGRPPNPRRRVSWRPPPPPGAVSTARAPPPPAHPITSSATSSPR